MRVTLYYEKLSLEVNAAKSHFEVASPPLLTGRSGITHRFDFIATDGQKNIAFDICDRVTETDLIKTFVKQLDTRASAFIICVSEKMTEGARRLAAEYGLKVLRTTSIGLAFRESEISGNSAQSATLLINSR